jgi:hypothetical protein
MTEFVVATETHAYENGSGFQKDCTSGASDEPSSAGNEPSRSRVEDGASINRGMDAETRIQCAPEYIGVLQFLVAFHAVINEEIKAYFRAGRAKKPTHALLHEVDASRLEQDLVHALRTSADSDVMSDHTASTPENVLSSTDAADQVPLLAHVHAALLNCLRIRKVDAQRVSGKDGWMELLAAEFRSKSHLYDTGESNPEQDSSCTLYDRDGTSVLDRCPYSMLSPMLRVLILQALCDVVAETNDHLRRAIWEIAKQEQEIGIRRRRRRRRSGQGTNSRIMTAAAAADGNSPVAQSNRSTQASRRESGRRMEKGNYREKVEENAPAVHQGLRAGDEAARFGPVGQDEEGWSYWIPGGLRAAAACGCFRIYRCRHASTNPSTGRRCALNSEPTSGSALIEPPATARPEIQIVVHRYEDRAIDMERLFTELGGEAMSTRNRKLWNLMQSVVLPELEQGYAAAMCRRNRRTRLAQTETHEATANAVVMSRERQARPGRCRPTYNEDELFDAVFAQSSDSSSWATESNSENDDGLESDTSWSQQDESRQVRWLTSRDNSDSNDAESPVLSGESVSLTSDEVSFETPPRRQHHKDKRHMDQGCIRTSNRHHAFHDASTDWKSKIDPENHDYDGEAFHSIGSNAGLSNSIAWDPRRSVYQTGKLSGRQAAASTHATARAVAARPPPFPADGSLSDDPIDECSSE